MHHLHSLTLSDLAHENARSHPLTTAVVDGEVRFTYAELEHRVEQLARALAERGVGSGSRVVWLGKNSFRVLEGLLACARIGAVFCPCNWRQSGEELSFVIDDLEPTVAVWSGDDLVDTVESLRKTTSDSVLWVRGDADGEDSYEGWVSSGGAPLDVEVRSDSPVLALYTAAFGGRPNAALLSHDAIVAHNMSLAMIRQIETGFVYLNSGPLFHIGTMMFCTATFHLGGTNVFMPSFDPREACRLVDEESCQSMLLFPPMDQQMVEANATGEFDLSSLRAAAGSDDWNAMVTLDESPWGRALGGYGQTEVAGMLTLTGLGIGADGSHGRPSPFTQIRIVDDEDRDVPPGEVGEMVARGRHVMSGYHNRPELTAYKQRNGWHHTGDLGRREADGTLTFIGPKLRMIKSSGENIYPAEVERALSAHPDVAECAVIGVPDPTWQQSVKAIVVLRPGAEADEHALVEHCREKIASYKKPRTVVFVDALPRKGFTPDYDVLDAQHGGGGYPGSD